jgi:4-hydroxy-3-polyprenylbenzoate decarboxylase
LEIVVGISGASGVIYGVRLLQALDEDCTKHLIITDSARKILELETDFSFQDVKSLADRCYDPDDFTASVASGSYLLDAMVVAPCSMRTLAGIAAGTSDTLLLRCADVCLKERRKLILVPREMPLSLVHLKNMVSASEAGAVILPACPSFYTKPKDVGDLVDIVVGRVIDILGIKNDLALRWGGNAYNSSGQSGRW